MISEIFRLNAQFVSAQNRLTQDIGLGSSRWRVLEAMSRASSFQHVAGLARIMQLTRQNVQKIINELEAEGYVAFASNPRNRQAKLVVLTAKGLRSYQTACRRLVPWANRLADGLSTSDIAEGTNIVRLLIERLIQDDYQAIHLQKPDLSSDPLSRGELSVHVGHGQNPASGRREPYS
jgi:DNA-binding MarR family transcriptional regulator